MNPIERKIREKLDKRREKNALRTLPGRKGLADFCSNDYLGLARDKTFRKELYRVAGAGPLTGATGSRLISGNSVLAEALEQELAAFHRAPGGLLFPSGYMANLGVLSAVADHHDIVLYDQLVHASIRDALQLCRARSYSFRHNDPNHLRQKLDRAKGNVFIVVESVYSMDGDEAPLEALASLAAEYGAALIVDEAHATGVFGEQGEGLVAALGLEAAVWARIHTFGKALGSHGAIVLGPGYLRDFLINFARSFIYTTALPDHTLHAVRLAYREMARGERLQVLCNNRDRFLRNLTGKARSRFIESRSAIQSMVWPGNNEVKALAGRLQQQGYDVRPILHPTVPKGTERLRICLHAHNTQDEVEGLAVLVNQVVEEHD
jgi:8-amino-7-oxononanoate synthase